MDTSDAGTENSKQSTANTPSPAVKPKLPASIHLGGPTTAEPTTTTTTPPVPIIKTPSLAPTVPVSLSKRSSIATKVHVEEEPRKMQTDLPVLLQDLGTSKLLQKFKQQQVEATSSVSKTTTPNPVEISADKSPTKSIGSKTDKFGNSNNDSSIVKGDNSSPNKSRDSTLIKEGSVNKSISSIRSNLTKTDSPSRPANFEESGKII